MTKNHATVSAEIKKLYKEIDKLKVSKKIPQAEASKLENAKILLEALELVLNDLKEKSDEATAESDKEYFQEKIDEVTEEKDEA